MYIQVHMHARPWAYLKGVANHSIGRTLHVSIITALRRARDGAHCLKKPENRVDIVISTDSK